MDKIVKWNGKNNVQKTLNPLLKKKIALMHKFKVGARVRALKTQKVAQMSHNEPSPENLSDQEDVKKDWFLLKTFHMEFN